MTVHREKPCQSLPADARGAGGIGAVSEDVRVADMLAKERKRHHLAMKTELDAAGIRPAFDHRTVYARFFRREDLN
jgi:hypothetical protein